jgi:EAL and modified HD-GYP domain-containing signal transduction protein
MFKWIRSLVGDAEKSRDAEPPAAVPPLRTDKAPAQGPLTTSADTPPSPISRHIILDRTAHILGYEFMLRTGTSSDSTTQRANDLALIRTINALDPQRIAQFREIWLAVGESTLEHPLLEALPGKATVVLVRAVPNHPPAPEILTRAAALRGLGFRFGLLGYADNPAHRAWLPLIDLVAMDVPSYAPAELEPAIAQIHGLRDGMKVVARRIDSYEGYEFCHGRGFDGFAGKFLTRRENWPPQPALNPDRVRLCDVLNRLRSGTELTEIAESLRLSPHISYRFLRYINSAGMGLTGHIASIEQGVLYLGREKLYRWLTLLLFAADGGQDTDRALLEQALMRARMLELMGLDTHHDHVQCDELFVVGMFSLFDVLLGMPLPIALRPLQLPKPVAGALIDNDGPYANLLRVVCACEQTDGDNDAAAESLDALAAAAGVSVERVNACHLEAIAWAQQLDTTPPPP